MKEEKKDRTLSFRMTANETEALREVMTRQGTRSLSTFIRGNILSQVDRVSTLV